MSARSAFYQFDRAAALEVGLSADLRRCGMISSAANILPAIRRCPTERTKLPPTWDRNEEFVAKLAVPWPSEKSFHDPTLRQAESPKMFLEHCTRGFTVLDGLAKRGQAGVRDEQCRTIRRPA